MSSKIKKQIEKVFLKEEISDSALFILIKIDN